MNNLSFAISKFDLMDISNSELMKVRLWIVSEGDNLHERFIPWESIESARPTLIGKPIVAKYNSTTQNLEGHELDEIAVGVILSDSDIFYETDESGLRWLCADGIIWTRYAKDVAFVLDRDQIENLSMEIVVVESGEDNSINSFVFSGITLIGTNPAIPNARAEVLSFSKVKEEIEHLMKFDSSQLNYKIPSIIKQNSEKGIYLKESYPKGATAINISIANQLINNEFASLDLLHNIIKFSAKIKTETAQYLLGGFESLEWAESIINPQIEFEEIKKEDNIVTKENMETQNEEVKTEEMSSDINAENTAQAEMNENQAEVNQELTEEGNEEMDQEEVMAEVVVVVTPEEDADNTEDNPVDDFQAKFEDMCAKYSALEVQMSEMVTKMSASDEQMGVYMAENTALKEEKMARLEQEKMAQVEFTLQEVSESMPKEKMEELREEAKTFSAENLNMWINKVKAEAFSFSKGQLNNDGVARIAFPWNNVGGNGKQDKNNVWNRI